MNLWTISLNADPRYSVYGMHGGGQGKFVRTVHQELPRHEWNVTTITSSAGSDGYTQDYNCLENIIDLETPDIPHWSLADIHREKRVVNQLRNTALQKRKQDRPDLILCCHVSSWPAAKALKIAFNVPITSTLCSMGYEKEQGFSSNEQNRISAEKEMITTSDKVFATTQSERDILKKHYQAEAESIIDIPRPIDTNLFSPGESQNTPSVLFVGRPTHQKGLDVFIDALALIDPNKRPIATVVGCSRKLFSEIYPEQAQSINRNNIYIRFIGSASNTEMPTILRAHTILAAPSRYETYGNIAVEAMACGIPVVASNTGGLKVHVSQSGAGVTFNDNSPLKLSLALDTLLSRPSYAAELGRLGRDYAKHHDVSSISALISTTLKKVGGIRYEK